MACIGVDGLHQIFGRSNFESETYTHCGVFHGLAATRADLLRTAALRQHDDPPWFHYEDAHYHNNL
jgi:hypothetical protein